MKGAKLVLDFPNSLGGRTNLADEPITLLRKFGWSHPAQQEDILFLIIQEQPLPFRDVRYRLAFTH